MYPDLALGPGRSVEMRIYTTMDDPDHPAP